MISEDSLQLLLTFVVLLMSWLALWFFGNLLVDYESVERWLIEKKWLALLAPKLRSHIVTWGWQFALAATIAVSAHTLLEGPAKYLKYACEPPLIFATPPPRWLSSELETLPVVGRKHELQLLDGFGNTPSEFSWWWFLGEDDVGLRRSASAWLADLPKGTPCRSAGFDAGFLRYDISPDFWKEFRPRRRTAIVVEDSSERVEQVRSLIEGLGARSSDLAHPVRVLLIDRLIPQELQELDVQRKYSPFRFNSPLELSSLGESELRLLADAVARVRGIVPNESSYLVGEMASRAGGHEWLAIITLAEMGAGNTRSDSYDEILQIQIQRLRAQLRSGGLPDQCFELLALSTLTNGLDWDFARKILPVEACLNPGPYERVLRQDAEEHIPGIRPQMLGGYFVLDQLSALTAPKQRLLIERAWDVNPSSTLAEIIWVNVDHPYHPKLQVLNARPSKESQLEPWAQFRAITAGISRVDKTQRDEHLGALRNLVKEYPDRPEFRRFLAQGLANATLAIARTELEMPPFTESGSMTPVWSELAELASEQKTDSEIHASLIAASTNVFLYYGNSLKAMAALERNEIPVGGRVLEYETRGPRLEIHKNMYDIWNEMAKYYRTIEETIESSERIAKSAVNVISAYSDLIDIIKKPDQLLIKAVEILYDLEARYADEPQIQLRCARGIVNTFRILNQIAPEDLSIAWSDLQRITDRFPSNLELQREKAIGAQNLVHFFGQRKDWTRIDQALNLLKETARQYGTDTEINRALAWGIANGVVAYSQQSDTDAVGSRLQDLTSIWATNLHLEEPVIFASRMLIQNLGQNSRWSAMTQIIDELEVFAAKHQGKEPVQIARVKWNLSATDQYGNGGFVNETELAWERLQLAAKHFPNDPGIQANLVTGALNTIFVYDSLVGRKDSLEEAVSRVWQVVPPISMTFQRDRNVQEAVVRAGTLTIFVYGRLNQKRKAEEVFQIVEEAAKNFPDDLVIQEILISSRELMAN